MSTKPSQLPPTPAAADLPAASALPAAPTAAASSATPATSVTPKASRFAVLRDFVRLPAYVQLLLITQLCFNIGFYIVLPYLAGYLGNTLGLAGATVGLILGLRSFSQQGMFVVGGTLADRYGPRPIILTGILIRIAGFLALGFSTRLPGVIAGVVLIGFAAALFSPAVESSIARAAGDVERDTGLPRTQVFAMNSVSSQLGSVLGPLIGSLMLLIDYSIACAVAAGGFACVWLAYFLMFPNIAPLHKGESVLAGWGEVLRNRVFLVFALAYSAYLVGYNQLYLALPSELTRSLGNDKLLGVMMAIGSLMVIVAQVRLTAWARQRLGARRAIVLGFSVMACGFAAVAVASLIAPLPRPWAVLPSLALIVLFTAGQMLASPFAADMVARMANERRLGAYYGLLNSCGGLAVLFGSTAVGALLRKGSHGADVAQPWLVTVALVLVSAAVIWTLMARNKLGERPAARACASAPSGTKVQ